MRTTLRKLRRDERGSMALELVILAPALIGLIMLLVAAGRFTGAEQQVDDAARTGARAASLERTLDTADLSRAARSAVTADSKDLPCKASTLEVYADPPVTTDDGSGLPAESNVVVHVNCDVDLSDIGLPGLHKTIAIHRSVSAPIDVLRGTG